MYEQFYNLEAEPFRLSPDARFSLPHPCYKKAKAYMQYALHRGEGFVMVTGQPGTGKSTLIDDLITDLSESGDTLFANLTCTQIQADDLLRLVVLNFGLSGREENKALLLHDLEGFFLRLRREGRRPLLIIDEAQDLPAEALEELRLLTNLMESNEPLLQIFLVGQEELRQTVLSPGLKQLHQRIVAACHLEPIDVETTEAYIKHRLSQVGWSDDPTFEDSIYPFIHKFSKGIPRLINSICGRLLLHGMVEDLHHIALKDVQSVVEDLIDEELLPVNRQMQQNPKMFWK
jgi:putative secretion ATPase (PEP-CTERM system associated)